MASTFYFVEGNGAVPGVIGSVSNFNFGTTDGKELTPASYPIFAGSNSYEKYVAGSWSGVFTKINNVQFYMSAGSYGTGEVIKWTGSSTNYVQPTTVTSMIAVGSLPTSDPGTANVSLGSSLTGSLVTEGRSDWIVMQYQITGSAEPGPVNQKSHTIQWDEQ
jgi:hypothetical protein